MKIVVTASSPVQMRAGTRATATNVAKANPGERAGPASSKVVPAKTPTAAETVRFNVTSSIVNY
jgi:hypothetical protein